MSARVPVNTMLAQRETERSFDSLLAQVLACLRRESNPNLEFLVLFESMKQQVLELAEERAGGVHDQTLSNLSPFAHNLEELEKVLFHAVHPGSEGRDLLLLLLCMAYYRAGNPLQAKHMAQSARCEYLDRGMEQKAGFADLLLAICCLELGQYEQAAERCVLAINETLPAGTSLDAAQIWQVYARVLRKQGRIEETVAALLMAQEIYKKQGFHAKRVKTALALSLVLAGQQDWYGAIFRLKQVLPVCHEHRLVQLELEVLHMLAHLFVTTGQAVEAEGCKQRICRILKNLEES